MIEIKLSKPIQVYNKAEGDYIDVDEIKIAFTGVDGVRQLKKMQDLVFETFSSKETSDKVEAPQNAVITQEELSAMLEMTGASEKIFNASIDAVKKFGRLGGVKVTDDYLNEMSADDIETISKEVVSNFLLPKILEMINSINK